MLYFPKNLQIFLKIFFSPLLRYQKFHSSSFNLREVAAMIIFYIGEGVSGTGGGA
jgi:hypothetical protein